MRLLIAVLLCATATTSGDLVDQLDGLARLQAGGSLTAGEFTAAKKKLLESPTLSPPPKPLDVAAWAKAGKRMMLVTAHPDDAEYFAGGLVAAFTAAGGNVCVSPCLSVLRCCCC